MSYNNNLAGSQNQLELHSKRGNYSFLVFQKTGGDQPTEIDAAEINHFFKGNYAKSWAMKDGFISTFRELKDGEIIFDMITDPRFRGSNYYLSKWIAEQYVSKVEVLNGSTCFCAIHFIARDRIGYLVNADTDPTEIAKLNAIFKEAITSLPTIPAFYHYGKISKFE